MRDPQEILVQTELSRPSCGGVVRCIYWLPRDRRVHQGSKISLIGLPGIYTVEQQFTTLPRTVVENQRGWRVGGLDDRNLGEGCTAV